MEFGDFSSNSQFAELGWVSSSGSVPSKVRLVSMRNYVSVGTFVLSKRRFVTEILMWCLAVIEHSVI